ncbi:hypothetical protein C8R43DRAFT_886970 [Mycena crocata]|nr:hypothetical protein C8R43DRAFT_886970 [Mycena crocata]
MLLLLLFAHVLSAHGLPVLEDRSESRGVADSCDDLNNCRKLFDVVWGCLATIFACTWISVHPNVPPPGQTPLGLLWRRMKMMLIGVIAPEIMVGFAARQFFAARAVAKDFEVSKTHGFFICMGGFVSRSGHHPIVAEKQLLNRPRYLADIRAVDAEDIKDTSKGAALSKGVALVQGLWFATQFLARVQQHLPVTELEVATMAFAVVNVFVWLLWWNKPLDVQQPILVGPEEKLPPDDGKALEKREQGLLKAKPWRTIYSDTIGGVLNGNYPHFDPTVYTSVPSFWSSGDFDQSQNGSPFGIGALVGIAFGAIHCAAWNAAFPSSNEMWMWRSCSLAVVALPVVIALIILAAVVVERSTSDSTTWKNNSLIIVVVSMTIYIVARLFLVVLPLIALRFPPPKALLDVSWSVYIPHF